jgi:hypothetical protein
LFSSTGFYHLSKIKLIACEDENVNSKFSVNVVSLATKSVKALEMILTSGCYLSYSPRGSYMVHVFTNDLYLNSLFAQYKPGVEISEKEIEAFFKMLIDDTKVSADAFASLLLLMAPPTFTVIIVNMDDGSIETCSVDEVNKLYLSAH